jgi:hypothetical protein
LTGIPNDGPEKGVNLMVTGNVTQDITDRDGRSGDDPSPGRPGRATRTPRAARAPRRQRGPVARQCPDNRWAGITRRLEAAQKGRA